MYIPDREMFSAMFEDIQRLEVELRAERGRSRHKDAEIARLQRQIAKPISPLVSALAAPAAMKRTPSLTEVLVKRDGALWMDIYSQ